MAIPARIFAIFGIRIVRSVPLSLRNDLFNLARYALRMAFIPVYHELAERIVAFGGGSDKLAHVHAGLALYYATQLMCRRRRASWASLQVVLACEVANEVMDRLFWGAWRWRDTAGDFAATLLWPTIIFAVGKYRRRRWAIDQAQARAMTPHFALAR